MRILLVDFFPMWHHCELPRPNDGSVQDHQVQRMNISHPHHPSVGNSQLGQWRQLSPSHLAICHHESKQRQLRGGTLVQGSTFLLNNSVRLPESFRLPQHHHCPLHHHHYGNPVIVNRSWPNRGQINNSNQLNHHHQLQFYPNIPPSIGGM